MNGDRNKFWIARPTLSQIFAGSGDHENVFSSIKYSHNSSEACVATTSHVRKVSRVAVHEATHSSHHSHPHIGRPLNVGLYEPSEGSHKECDRDDDQSSCMTSDVDGPAIDAIDRMKIYKTLIVDDSTLSRNMLARLLRS